MRFDLARPEPGGRTHASALAENAHTWNGRTEPRALL